MNWIELTQLNSKQREGDSAKLEPRKGCLQSCQVSWDVYNGSLWPYHGPEWGSNVSITSPQVHNCPSCSGNRYHSAAGSQWTVERVMIPSRWRELSEHNRLESICWLEVGKSLMDRRHYKRMLSPLQPVLVVLDSLLHSKDFMISNISVLLLLFALFCLRKMHVRRVPSIARTSMFLVCSELEWRAKE